MHFDAGGWHGRTPTVCHGAVLTALRGTNPGGARVPVPALHQAATAPSLRGSDAPSRTPFGCRTIAPAWPIMLENAGTISTSCPAAASAARTSGATRSSSFNVAVASPQVGPKSHLGAVMASWSGVLIQA